MNAESSVPRFQPTAAIIAVGIINLAIGLWCAAAGAWTCIMAPKLAYMSGELVAQSSHTLREGDRILGRPEGAPVGYADLSTRLASQMHGAFDWAGLSALGWYTFGVALCVASVGLLCGRAWARTTSRALCVAGAALQIASVVALFSHSPIVDHPESQMASAMVKYAGAVTGAALLAYFALAVAVLWSRRSTYGAATVGSPVPMGFPATARQH